MSASSIFSTRYKCLQRAATVCIAACLLAGCSRQPPAPGPLDYPDLNLARTPFFPQKKYQCGPAALATVLAASGARVTPDELVPRVYLPGRKGSLREEMIAAAREYGRIPYRIDPDLTHILDELDAGRPVLVFQNLGIRLLPVWHYAVVTGFDPASRELLLHSGINAHARLDVGEFMRTWQPGGNWAMVVLEPGELPANPDIPRYLKAVVAMERTQNPQQMAGIYLQLTKQFPNQAIGWIGLANSYQASGSNRKAALAYRQALGLDPGQVAARNNLALVLDELGCHARALVYARSALEMAQKQSLFVSQSEDTLRQVERGTENAVDCPVF